MCRGLQVLHCMHFTIKARLKDIMDIGVLQQLLVGISGIM